MEIAVCDGWQSSEKAVVLVGSDGGGETEKRPKENVEKKRDTCKYQEEKGLFNISYIDYWLSLSNVCIKKILVILIIFY